MALVNPLDSNHNEEIRQLAEFFNETLGFCPNSVLTMQHRPRIAKAFIELNMAVMENNGRVTSELKRLIGYMTSYVAGCNYCQAHTIRAAERYGASEEKLLQIWEFRTNSLFSEAERVVLELAIAASTVPNGVDSEVQNNVRKHWNDGEIVEILGVISLFGYLNRWNDSMGTVLENDAIASGEKYLSNTKWNIGKHKSK